MIIVIPHFRVTRSSPKTRFDHERRYRARALSNITSKIINLLFLCTFSKNKDVSTVRGHVIVRRALVDWIPRFISLCILSRVSICYQWVISDEHVVTKILHLAKNQIIKLSVISNYGKITILTIIATNRSSEIPSFSGRVHGPRNPDVYWCIKLMLIQKP